MTRFYLAREQLITASITKTPLQKFGSTTSTSDILVPSGAASLNHLIGWYSNGVAAAETIDILFRTEGNGLPNGPECWTAGAWTVGTATNDSVAGQSAPPVYYTNVGLPVKGGGNTVQLFGDLTTNTGTVAATQGVLCIFDTSTSPATVTRTYDGQSTTTQTDKPYLLQASNTTPPLNTPSGISRLARVTFAGSSLGGTAAGMLYLLRILGQAVGTELDLVVGSGSSIIGTGPVGSTYATPFQIGHDAMSVNYPNGLDVPAIPSTGLTVQFSNAETNIGTSQTAVTLEFV